MLERLPDFLIIGAQKGATTWLAHVLQQHPRVFMPAEELHFFNYPTSVASYARAFQRAHPDQLVGEKTADYLHMTKKQIAYVRKLLPSVRLIVVLRDPVARAWSQARMEISVLNERPLRKKDRLGLALHVHLLRNRLRSDYRRALQRWFRFFPRDQLLLLFYEDFMRDPVAFVNRVFTFLGLDSLPASVLQEKVARRIWVSPPEDMPHWLRYALMRRYVKQTQWLVRHGYTVPPEWPRSRMLKAKRPRYVWKATLLSWAFTLLALPEWGMTFLGRHFPLLRLHRFYDQLQQWRARLD